MKIALYVDGEKVASMEHDLCGKQLPALARHYGVTGLDLARASEGFQSNWDMYGKECTLEADND